MLVAALALLGAMPQGLRKSLDAFWNQEATVRVGAWSRFDKGKTSEYTPMSFLNLHISKGKLRIQADRGYGVWDGTKGVVVHRSNGKLSFTPCSKKRQVLQAFGLDQVLMGPVGDVTWHAPFRLTYCEAIVVDGRAISPPTFDHYGVRRVIDGRKVGLNWRMHVDGTVEQVDILTRSKGHDDDKYFSFGKPTKFVANERTFLVEHAG